jgi:hypothetical protein
VPQDALGMVGHPREPAYCVCPAVDLGDAEAAFRLGRQRLAAVAFGAAFGQRREAGKAPGRHRIRLAPVDRPGQRFRQGPRWTEQQGIPLDGVEDRTFLDPAHKTGEVIDLVQDVASPRAKPRLILGNSQAVEKTGQLDNAGAHALGQRRKRAKVPPRPKGG